MLLVLIYIFYIFECCVCVFCFSEFRDGMCAGLTCAVSSVQRSPLCVCVCVLGLTLLCVVFMPALGVGVEASQNGDNMCVQGLNLCLYEASYNLV